METALIAQFRAIVGESHCISEPDQLLTYECDALTSFRVRPGLVVLPRSTEEVVQVVRLARAAGLPIVPRGSGTGLSGCVEPGAINLEITKRIAPHGYYYAPDPSSQQVCTIGGNVSENSGGAHCLKYGFTTNHVLSCEVVLPDGSLVHLGGKTVDAPGYDLCGVFVGSEGTLGIATKIILRVVKKPEAVETL